LAAICTVIVIDADQPDHALRAGRGNLIIVYTTHRLSFGR
jgi:hypothetical protein